MDHSHGNDNGRTEQSILSDKQCASVAACFSKLGDSTRLKIFCILCHSEQCVINLAALIKMSSPAVAHHLRLLKDAGLIESRREGKEMYYRLSGSPHAAEMHKAVDIIFDLTRLHE